MHEYSHVLNAESADLCVNVATAGLHTIKRKRLQGT